jgi:UDP-glucose 4-epimerase
MARRTPSGGAIVNDLRGAYASRSVLVTGGASFIGSHLVERLLDLGADVVVVDDFSSGKRENLAALEPGRIIELDLADRVRTFSELPACEIVLHLAAVHG